MAELVTQTIELSKRFGKHRAVDSLGVRVEKGSVYGLLGPNGAGKTTLLKMLVGLLRPTEGEVRLFGERWRRGHLGRVGTLIEAPALYGHLTGRENLEVHRRLLGLPKGRIDEVLGTVDLLGALRKKHGEPHHEHLYLHGQLFRKSSQPLPLEEALGTYRADPAHPLT